MMKIVMLIGGHYEIYDDDKQIGEIVQRIQYNEKGKIIPNPFQPIHGYVTLPLKKWERTINDITEKYSSLTKSLQGLEFENYPGPNKILKKT